MVALQSVLLNLGQWFESHTLLITIISTIVGVLGFVFTVVGLIGTKRLFPQNRKWRKDYLSKIPNDFKDERSLDKIYIQPYFTFLPKEEKDKEPQVPPKQLLNDFFIQEVFVKNSDKDKVYCLLGDTGTGKTAALVHLFADYINSHKKSNLPYEVRILSLRNKDVFDNINAIEKEEREKYILLLDALDENPMANDPEFFTEFSENLNNACRDYRFVIYTCRPQFFKDKEAETGLVQATDGNEWIFATRLRLSPFDDQQVESFLNQVFGPSETELRQKADQLLEKREFIDIRPLVLTHIRDIVQNNREIHNTLDLYDSIVESWFTREMKKISPIDLERRVFLWWQVTSQVASYIYMNKVGQELSLTVDELREAIGHDEWTELLNSMGIKTENEQPDSMDLELFRRRSLLTRIDNKYLFTHKSFYEYFMAYRFFLDYEEVDDMRGMDFALQLVDDLYDAYQNHRSVRFANIGGIELNDMAGTYHQLGYFLYEINHFKEAEKEYQMALKIYRDLAAKNPDAYLPRVADTLNNLALLHADTNQLELAEEEYQEALKIYRDLAAKKPDAYLPYVALTLNNLANLHVNTDQLEPAEEEYQKALEIRRDLAAKNPDAYLPYVAGTLNNLAVLHKNTNRLELAEEEYQEALKIYRDLAATNPDAYLPYVALTLNNLAILHSDTNQLELAEEEYQEALEIRRGLAAKNPDAYLPDVAQTLNNLALLHANTNQLEPAEEEYQEALKIYRELVATNPDAYLPYVALTLYNMALLYIDTEDLETAETIAQESLEKYKIMAELSHAAFDPYVEKAELLLDIIKELRKNKS